MMSLLRIYASIADPPQRCQWVLFDNNGAPVNGEGPLEVLPTHAGRVQLVIPAVQMLILRARVPREARRRAGQVLAFAVEEKTLGDPDGIQVSWLGAAGDEDLLAVIDKQALQEWRNALAAVGIRDYELHCETLMLPRENDEWSLAWNGCEGFVCCGDKEGAATDRGDGESPPLSLCLMLEEAKQRGERPNSIAVYATQSDATVNVALWEKSLEIPLRLAGAWNWRTSQFHAGLELAQERQRWRSFAGLSVRLRPAAMILGAALAIHAGALTLDWIFLVREQRALQHHMEMIFRGAFPDAVAVVDPALQMRRKLAEARHNAGLPDDGDFLPMIERVSAAMNDLPANSLHLVSYERGRLTLEIAASEEGNAQRVVNRLRQERLSVDTAPLLMRGGSGDFPPRGKMQTMTIVVRTS